MATIQKLSANRRKELGTTACRRLRRSGLVPGNVYGHGQEPVAISFDGELIRPVVTSGAHVVNLELDGESQTALIRDVQWDTFSTYVRHLDLVRVDANERVRLSVTVQLKGTAIGTMAGGIVEQPLHALHIECPAIQIPDFISVKVGHLEIGQSVHVRELTDVPEGVAILDSPDALIVHIVKPGIVEEPSAEAVPGPAEPELIKREKKTEDEDA
ncbi:MAG: 50S ribosomal protein L25 [Planctomycetaceae bacterium]|nr:50S ribosomal protein L25 [Planctomycetaceae bacterium]